MLKTGDKFTKPLLNIVLADLENWLDLGVQPTDYKFVGAITNQTYLADYTDSSLDQRFAHCQWNETFNTNYVIFIDVALTPEWLINLHQWLRTKPADITNITILTTHVMGMGRWWKQWCETFHAKSFNIIEWPFSSSIYYRKKYFTNITLPTDIQQVKSSPQYLFSYYGGSYGSLDRVYLTLKLLEFNDSAVIDYIGNLPELSTIVSYVESITYFNNDSEVQRIVDAYNRYVTNFQLNASQARKFQNSATMNSSNYTNEVVDYFANHATTVEQQKKFQNSGNVNILDERLNFQGLQWSIDQTCWATVVRETRNSDYYSYVTEKTLRGFLHHMIVIPTGFESVINLEQLGFVFCHNIVDYSYQFEKDFYLRVEGMVKELRKLKNLSATDMQKHLNDNWTTIAHNAKRVCELITHPPSC